MAYKIVLDAGHGGKDPGTSGNGMQEKNLTLTIAQKIEQELRGSGIKVYMTRDRDVYPENSTRAKIANDVADLMVSISIPARKQPTAQKRCIRFMPMTAVPG